MHFTATLLILAASVDSRQPVSRAVLRLSRRLSPWLNRPPTDPLNPMIPDNARIPPYYRGCWHGVSRCLFVRYRQACPTHGVFLPYKSSLQPIGQSSCTRHGWIRLPPIVQYSSLLPPVGVWSVSQYQCGDPSQGPTWIVALVRRYRTNKLMGRMPIPYRNL